MSSRSIDTRYLFDEMDSDFEWRGGVNVMGLRYYTIGPAPNADVAVYRTRDGSWSWIVLTPDFDRPRTGCGPTKLAAIRACERALMQPVPLPSWHPVIRAYARALGQHVARAAHRGEPA